MGACTSHRRKSNIKAIEDRMYVKMLNFMQEFCKTVNVKEIAPKYFFEIVAEKKYVEMK